MPTPPPVPTATLAELFLEIFDADELRRWLRGLPEGAVILRGLPSAPASLELLAESAVGALDRHGRLHEETFRSLREARPARATRIEEVAALFEVVLSGDPGSESEEDDDPPWEGPPELAPPTRREALRISKGDLGESPLHRRDRILTAFYGSAPAGAGRTGLYTFRLDDRRVSVPVATRAEWVGWRTPVRLGVNGTPGLDVRCLSSAPPPPDTESATRYFAQHLQRLQAKGKRMSADPQCRLLEVGTRRLRFGEGRYDQWRMRGTGLLEDELQLALLRSAGQSPDRTAQTLRWRREMMPDLDAVTALDRRVCLGGVQVVTVWRSKPEARWSVLYTRRNLEQGDNPGAYQCLPRGFHEPPRPAGKPRYSFCEEIPHSVVREFGEELLGFKILGDLGSYTEHLELLDNLESAFVRAQARLWLNGLVFSLDNGNYELMFTLLLDERFGQTIEELKREIAERAGEPARRSPLWVLNWEVDPGDRPDQGPRQLRLHPTDLERELRPSELAEWVPGSRAALVETLMLLRDVEGVDLGGDLQPVFHDGSSAEGGDL